MQNLNYDKYYKGELGVLRVSNKGIYLARMGREAS